MQEQPEIERFVKMGPDGPERVHEFAPFPMEGDKPQVRMLMVPVPGDGSGELRHLSYDDPPGLGGTEEEYKAMLARAVSQADDLEDFTSALLFALGKDLVFSHNVDPQRAVEAITEFAAKVYQEFRAV